MKQLSKGTYYGSHYQKSVHDGLLITDTKYTHNHVDWHRHERPYFTYILQGKLYESNKKNDYYLTPGGLLFHNWQDLHYNTKPDEFTRGFHIELNEEWFTQNKLPIDCFEGSHLVENPVIKSLINSIFMESKINDQYSQLSIDALMLDTFTHLTNNLKKQKKPSWLSQLKELMHEERKNYSLTTLSSFLSLHPAHLSREFHRYFGMTFGQYIRTIRINKAFIKLIKSHKNLTDLSYECGFYDQSHFIREFKRVYERTPKAFVKMLNLYN